MTLLAGLLKTLTTHLWKSSRAYSGVVPTGHVTDSLSNEDIAPDYLKAYFKGSEVEPLNNRELTDLFYGTIDRSIKQ